jgi:hypothetical protein
MKTGGYPADWAEYLIGHAIGTQQSYIPPTDTLGQEWLKIDHRFCFLGNPLTSEAVILGRALSPKSGTPDMILATESSKSSTNVTSVVGPVQSNGSFSTKRWASKAYSYVKTFISSIDYDQALADGYTIFDGDGVLRVLRKRGNHLRRSAAQRSFTPRNGDLVRLAGKSKTGSYRIEVSP